MEHKQIYGAVLLKADKILQFLSRSSTPQKLSEIANATELTSSTALKILDTLLLIRYVEKDVQSKTFRLGPAIMQYANKGIHQLDIKQVANPHLERLQALTTETVHLGIQDKGQIVYITKLASNKPVSLYSEVGKGIPLYCSAMGKAVLADQSDQAINDYLSSISLVKKTAHTILSKEKLREEIAAIRHKGYAFDNGEHQEDVFCIGASITVNDKTHGALCVSAPAYRVTPENLQSMIDAVLTCKQAIRNELQQEG